MKKEKYKCSSSYYFRFKIVELVIDIIFTSFSIIMIIVSIYSFKNSNLFAILLSIFSSLLVAFFVAAIMLVKELIENHIRRIELLNRIVEKSTILFLLFVKKIDESMMNEDCHLLTFIQNLHKGLEFKLDNSMKTIKKYLHNDLVRCNEAMFKKEEWKGINTSLVYLDIVFDWRKTISDREIAKLLDSLILFPKVKNEFDNPIYALYIKYQFIFKLDLNHKKIDEDNFFVSMCRFVDEEEKNNYLQRFESNRKKQN